jgi:GAF domain-containing protein
MKTAIKTDLKALLNLVIEKEGADKGTLQKYQPEKKVLEVIEAEGFSKEFLEHFKMVKPFDSSCCGRAFGVGSTIIISDVELDEGFKPNLEIARSEGFRAVKSMPILDNSAHKIGVISVHFSEPKWNWDLKRSEVILPLLAEALKEL